MSTARTADRTYGLAAPVWSIGDCVEPFFAREAAANAIGAIAWGSSHRAGCACGVDHAALIRSALSLLEPEDFARPMSRAAFESIRSRTARGIRPTWSGIARDLVRQRFSAEAVRRFVAYADGGVTARLPEYVRRLKSARARRAVWRALEDSAAALASGADPLAVAEEICRGVA